MYESIILMCTPHLNRIKLLCATKWMYHGLLGSYLGVTGWSLLERALGCQTQKPSVITEGFVACFLGHN